jgi:hypothetical protein
LALLVGIDLTSSPQKPSAYATLSTELKVLRLDLLTTNDKIIAAIEGEHPLVVAIDAPLSLPQGLCCLEESCNCQPQACAKGRVCERELRAKYGIPSYYTTKRSIIKGMAYRAIALKDELSAKGQRLIEVYPYATKVRLWGKAIPKKTKPEGLEFLQEHLTALIPGLERKRLKNHDLCDAVLAAYTAYLYHGGLAEPVGDAEEGLIFIPCIS